MRIRIFRRLSSGSRWGLAFVVLAVIGGAATVQFWLPAARELVRKASSAANHAGHAEAKPPAGAPDAHHHDEDGDHDHDADHDEHGHDGDHDEHGHAEKGGKPPVYDHPHDEAATVKLSESARKNIGLRLAKVELKPFERTMTVPGIIVERPGWSVLEITAPMTGVVTRIYPIQGQAVQPDQPLFDVRLSHEDLLQAQTEFLRTVEELDVIRREVGRLEKVTADGLVAGKTLLERQYERQKAEALLRTQRQALLLHGLSGEQIDRIVATRTLLQSLTIRAPLRDCCFPSPAAAECSLQVQTLKVVQGKHVNAGETLCTLVDHHELYIEGMAFEQDIQAVNGAAAAGQKVSALLGSKSAGDEEMVRGLGILYLDDKVDRESRAFHFFVTLPNRLLREDKNAEGRRFVYWRFKPGQRTQVRVPVEHWTDRIVLPVEAVAQEGAESYVFEANDGHFDRRAVHVEYRDQESVVIANDGTLRLGATVAATNAHQMQLALKNKAGGGVDPHAGHNH
jgi:membrane fusion protein, heavy metal efflux system